MDASDRREIRVLYVLDSAEIGGGPRHLLLLMKDLDRRRFRPFMCYMKGGAMAPELCAVMQAAARVGGGPTGQPGAIGDLVRYIRQWRIDLVHLHGTRAGLVGGLASRWADVPSVYTIHNLSVDRTDQPALTGMYELAERVICALACRVISVSDVNRRAAIDRGIVAPKRIVTIRNWVCLEMFRTIVPSRRVDNVLTVGVVGRLVPQKGHRYFVQAAYEVTRLRSDVRFVAIGEGPLETSLREMVRDLGLEPWFRFAGATRDGIRALNDLDVVVISSLWEGLPYVLLEALALEKPVVATRVNGIEEVVEDGTTGILVPPGDPDALAQALLELVDDPERRTRLGKAGAEHVRRAFDAREGTRRTMEVYEDVMA